MNVRLSDRFAEYVAELDSEERTRLRGIVDRIIGAPYDYDHPNLFPWGGGCVEKKWGHLRIVYCICGNCRKEGEPHEDCEGGVNRKPSPDDTLYFRTIYPVF